MKQQKSKYLAVNLLPLAALAAAGFLSLSNSTDAAVTSIDFGTGKGTASGDTVTSGGDSDAVNSVGQIFTGQVGAWNSDTGVTGSGPQSFATIEGPVFTINPAGSAQMSVNHTAFTNNNVLRGDYYWADSNVIPWELTGLAANGTYNITFFEGTDPGGAVSTIGGVLGTADAERDYDFTGVTADGTGKITGTWNDTPDVANRASWGGMQFELVPEPSTTALLGLGGLALILRRRK